MVDVGIVTVKYEGDLLGRNGRGFGYLVSPTEDCDIIGATFDSCIFSSDPEAPLAETSFTVMMGGHRFSERFGDVDEVADKTLESKALAEIERHMNINREPLEVTSRIQRACIPQYKVGHATRLKDIHDGISHFGLGRLCAIGASYKGVAVPDCIMNARIAGERVAAAIDTGTPLGWTGLNH